MPRPSEAPSEPKATRTALRGTSTDRKQMRSRKGRQADEGECPRQRIGRRLGVVEADRRAAVTTDEDLV
jgi:hypothetical protein